MTCICIEREIFYQKEVYIIDNTGQVYIPIHVKALVNPFKNNDSTYFRKVVDSELVRRVLERRSDSDR